MALKYLQKECTVDDLMQQAKDLNFTKNGEMFDGKFFFFAFITLNSYINHVTCFLLPLPIKLSQLLE